jgi:small subunit ribosomal protein S4e
MSKHLKRLAAPRSVQLHRKEKKWTMKASPGPHPLAQTVPLGIIIRDFLGLCNSYQEVKQVIANGEILIDNTPRKNHKFPCGLMDVISIPKLKQYYRVLFDRRGKLTLVSISESESQWKLCRIQNKTILKDKQMQLNLHDGRNILVKKDEYKTGDVLKFSFKDNKISDALKFENGNVALITGGSHIGQIANIAQVQIVPSSKSNLTIMKGDNEFSTLTDYVFPIGKKKPVVSLPEVKMK